MNTISEKNVPTAQTIISMIPNIKYFLASNMPSFFAFEAKTVPIMEIIKHGNGDKNAPIKPAIANIVYSVPLLVGTSNIDAKAMQINMITRTIIGIMVSTFAFDKFLFFM